MKGNQQYFGESLKAAVKKLKKENEFPRKTSEVFRNGKKRASLTGGKGILRSRGVLGGGSDLAKYRRKGKEGNLLTRGEGEMAR